MRVTIESNSMRSEVVVLDMVDDMMLMCKPIHTLLDMMLMDMVDDIIS